MVRGSLMFQRYSGTVTLLPCRLKSRKIVPVTRDHAGFLLRCSGTSEDVDNRSIPKG